MIMKCGLVHVKKSRHKIKMFKWFPLSEHLRHSFHMCELNALCTYVHVLVEKDICPEDEHVG